MTDLLSAIQPADQFGRATPWVAVKEHVAAGHSCAVGGLWGSGCAYFLASILDAAPSIVLVVTTGPEEADDLVNDINLFRPDSAVLFPIEESLPSEESSINLSILGQRLEVLRKLLFYGAKAEPGRRGRAGNSGPPLQARGPAGSGGPPLRVIVAPVQSLMQPVETPENLQTDVLTLRPGDSRRIDQIAEWLVERGFDREPMVEMHGEFAIRGGILDIFPPAGDNPVRVEFFGDEIESIREFDAGTQRSITPLTSVQLVGVPRSAGKLVPKSDLSTSVFSYLPKNAWAVLREPVEIQERAQNVAASLQGSQELFGFPDLYQASRRFTSIHVSGLAAASDLPVFDFHTGTTQRFGGELKSIIDELHRLASVNETVNIFCENDAQEARLREVLKETDLAAEPKIVYRRGFLSAGFTLAQPPVVFVGHHEIFSRYQRLRTASTRRRSAPIESFLELRKGDYVVHVTHGIAKFRGMETVQKEGETQEFLVLEFAGSTKLYVPASKIDLVQRYIGTTKLRPKLSVIGGKQWGEKKAEAKRAIQDMALDLLHLQAIRERTAGIAYPSDSLWQHEFEDAFLYQETDDQLTVLAEIKADMESAKPMDRLLCGDVGYGKTELAMRASFKVAIHGMQVAVLVPTTVLAAQHYRTFTERMADFPVIIEMLSRFKTHKEQREIIERVKRGKVDILIGTHRLLSKDVEFRDLGLLIIDEEQRFGVKHKERLKHFRETVDVLTMTATPIPRTLHMAMLGMRDISSLNTPPQDRQSIRSEVCRFDYNRIREAILREVHRDGQVFFVHNRVYNIKQIRDEVQQIVPEATYTIAHGQMNEHELEARMTRFVAGDIDVLICTTIIESGLDIPNANTIIINRADNFGLADLHQLRGRVGRYKNRAYAYFMVPTDKPITQNSVRRLKAIEEYSELGAGFKIAMRDLEIRGAGNILGFEQSGHISAVGYDLYCKLLDQTVRELKNQPIQEPLDVDLEINLDAFIPDDYAPDPSLKMGIYRKLAAAQNLAEIEDLGNELADRFGELPDPVRQLIERHRVRLLAHRHGIRYISRRKGFLLVKFTDPNRINKLFAGTPYTARIIDVETLHLHLPPKVDAPEHVARFLEKVLGNEVSVDGNAAVSRKQ